MPRFIASLIAVSLAFSVTTAHADIFQWEYIDPNDPSLGKRQSFTIAPDGAGLQAQPGLNASGKVLPMAYLIGANLTVANFSNAYLIQADLSQANLTNANFSGAALYVASLAGAEVRGATFARNDEIAESGSGISASQLASTASHQVHDLTGINLHSNTLDDADLSGQNLSQANLTSTSLNRANLTSANFSGANLTGAFVSSANFADSNITLAQLYSTASYQQGNLGGIGLANANLTGADFAGKSFEGSYDANFTSANLTQANLTNARLPSATLTNATFTDAEIRFADFIRRRDPISGTFYGTGIVLAQLYSTASYKAHDLTGVGLGGASLVGADFIGQNLTDAKFNFANLVDADLRQANLINANFPNATLTGANFSGANVRGAVFDRHDSQVGFSGTGITAAQLYTTASYVAGDLAGINLGGNDFASANFAGKNFTNSKFFLTTLNGTDLSQANLTGASLIAAKLTNANLMQANLTNADLTAATLSGANFAGSNIRGANLSRYSYELGVTISSAQLNSTASYQSHDLTGIALGYNNLAGFNFANQNLTDASFAYTNLANVNLNQANLTLASFFSANLSGANLSHSNLTDTIFAGAILTGTNLTGAEIRGANFSQLGGSTSGCGPKHNGGPCEGTPFTIGTGISLPQLYSTATYATHDLSDVQLQNSNFSGGNFAGFKLTQSSFEGSAFVGANLSGADTRGTYPIDLTGATVANLIYSVGDVLGLDLSAGQSLVIRDYDGPNYRFGLPNLISVRDHFAMGTGATLQLQLEADLWDSQIWFDPDIPVTLGGTLELLFADGTNAAAQIGRTIRLFDWNGVAPTGVFAISSPYAWNLSNLYTTGEVTLAAVPEPSTLLLLCFGSLAVFWRRRRLACASILAAAVSISCANHALAVTTVPVGNPGNPADQNYAGQGQFGAVPYDFRIAVHEVTNTEYVSFLNAQVGILYPSYFLDPLQLFDLSMEQDPRGGIWFDPGPPPENCFCTHPPQNPPPQFRIKPGMGNTPVNFVNWYDAARYTNWLNNGQGSGSTENGAYSLGAIASTGFPFYPQSIERNHGATWFLPSEDEWYKAAYHQPASDGGDSDNYWISPAGNNVTTVGSIGPSSASYYGTLDQGGNVQEWLENANGSNRVVRGGYWDGSNNVNFRADQRTLLSPAYAGADTGFRVAHIASGWQSDHPPDPPDPPSQTDIFQWEYINPADPGQGKRQSTTLCVSGAGARANPNVTFWGSDLSMAYLIGANLTNARVGFAKLIDADLSHANLTHANFETLNDLTGANFRQANLAGAGFGSTNLANADFTQANLTNASFAYSTLTGARYIDAEVRGAQFRGDSYSGGITLEQLYSTASYKARDLTGIGLNSQNLTGANLAGQNLSNATFGGSVMTDVNLADAEVRGAIFGRTGPLSGEGTGLTLEQLYSTASYMARDLSGIYLADNNLAGADLTSQNLRGAAFFSTVLTGANLSRADLTNANCMNADLSGANLSHANLTNVAFFYEARLSDANLSGADTRGALYLEFPSSAITTNLIRPNGHIAGLDLTAGESLVIRDYDSGNPDYILDPPIGPLPIVVEQHFAMDATGTLRMVFDADAWDSTISFAPGVPVTRGGTLELSFAPNVNLTSQIGRTIDLFDWTGVSPTGAFTVSSPYVWNLSNLYTTGEVTLADVPEPSTLLLLCFGSLAVLWRRRRLVSASILAAAVGITGVSAHAVTIDTVRVGKPGNAGDVQSKGTFGAVPYNYCIGKTDVANALYVEFLNGVDTSTNDRY